VNKKHLVSFQESISIIFLLWELCQSKNVGLFFQFFFVVAEKFEIRVQNAKNFFYDNFM